MLTVMVAMRLASIFLLKTLPLMGVTRLASIFQVKTLPLMGAMRLALGKESLATTPTTILWQILHCRCKRLRIFAQS